MALENPNVFEVSYAHPAGHRRSAARIVRYLTRRPLDRDRPTRESEWRTLPKEQVFGDPETFKREASRRTRELREEAERRGKDLSKNKSARACSYLHVVLSPSRRAQFSDADFRAILEPWIKDANGRELPFFGAIHREEEGREHLHLVIARDKVEKRRELPRLKERTAEIVRERERMLVREREPEKEFDREPKWTREARARDGFSGREHER